MSYKRKKIKVTRCPDGEPHWYLMEWRGEEHWGVCKRCGREQQENNGQDEYMAEQRRRGTHAAAVTKRRRNASRTM